MAMPNSTIEPITVDAYLELVSPDVIRVKGHRIGLEHIVERYQEGYSAEQIADEYPGVGLPAIYAIIAYYLHHTDMVENYLARVNARAEAAYQMWLAAPPSAATIRIRALKAQRARTQEPES